MSHVAIESRPRTAIVTRMLPWLALGSAAVFAYGRVVFLDPYPSLRSTAGPTEDFFFAPQGGSPVLLLLVTGLLIHHRREAIVAALGQPAAPVLATAFGLPAIGLYVWAHYVAALDLAVISLSLMLLAAGALLGGRRGVRVLLLPAVFLLLLVPLPGVLLNAIVYPMQLATARTTAWLLSLFGIGSALQGDQLLTSTGMFHVIETCSGLRIIETMTMSGVLYAELFHRNRRQVMILIAIGPLVGVLVNQVRVFSMVMNPLSYVSSVHTAQGIIMLVGGVLSIALIDRLLAWLDPRIEARASWTRLPTDRGSDWSAFRARFLSLVGVLSGLGLMALLVPAWAPGPDTGKPLYTLPAVIGEWRAAGAEMPESFLGSVRFSESIRRLYSSEAGEIDLFMGADDRLDRYTSLRSQKTLVFQEGGYVAETLSVGGVGGSDGGMLPRAFADEFERVIVQGWQDRWLVVHWSVGVESLPHEAVRALLALDRSPLRRTEDALVVRIATPIDPGSDGLLRAANRLDDFLPGFFAALTRVKPDLPLP